MNRELSIVADALEALPFDVFPCEPYTLGREGAREVIDAALETARARTGLTKRELYPTIRLAILPEGTLPLPDIVRFLGRPAVLPRLRAAVGPP